MLSCLLFVFGVLACDHAQGQSGDEISETVKAHGGPGLFVLEVERLDKIDSTKQ